MTSQILASVDAGLPSHITQIWQLWDYPEHPYIVWREYRVDDTLHEIRIPVLHDQIQDDPLGRPGCYFCSVALKYSQSQDVIV